MSVAIGFSALVPGFTTFEISPVALLAASAGGAVRSGGALNWLTCAWAAGGTHRAASARASVATGRIKVLILKLLF